MEHQSGKFQLVIVTEPVKSKFFGDAHVNLRAQRLLRSRQYMPLQRGRAETRAGCDGKEITAIAGLMGVTCKKPRWQRGIKLSKSPYHIIFENEKSGMKIFLPKTAFACFPGKRDKPARGRKKNAFVPGIFFAKVEGDSLLPDVQRPASKLRPVDTTTCPSLA